MSQSQQFLITIHGSEACDWISADVAGALNTYRRSIASLRNSSITVRPHEAEKPNEAQIKVVQETEFSEQPPLMAGDFLDTAPPVVNITLVLPEGADVEWASAGSVSTLRVTNR